MQTELDAENAIIGCLLFDNSSFALVSKILTRDDFKSPKSRAIWDQFAQAASEGRTTDLVIMGPALKKAGVIKATFELNEMLNHAALPAMVENYALTLKESSDRSTLRDLGREIHRRASIDKPADVVAYATEHLSTSRSSALMEPVSFADAIEEFRNERQISAHPVGLQELQEAMSGGLHFGGTLLIGGDAKSGKTVLTLNFLRECMRLGTPSYVISRDQLYRHIAGRMWSAEVGVPRDSIRASSLAQEALTPMKNWPLWFHRGEFDIDTVCAAVKVACATKGVRVWVLDFLQRIQIKLHGGEKQESGFVRIADRLSDLAQDTNTCGVVISRVTKPSPGGNTQHRFAGEAGVQNACDGMLFVHTMKDANETLKERLDEQYLRTIEVLPGRHWGGSTVALMLDGAHDRYLDFKGWSLGQKDAWLEFKRSKK
jgi:replicative DNA helicase